MKRFHLLFPAGRPLRWILPTTLLLAVALLQGIAPGWLDRLEGWSIDARFHLRGPEAPRSPIVIVALDEASFQTLGDLQGENIRIWPRARWASLLNVIASGKPKLIGLDVVFDTPGWDAHGDEILAQVLAQAGNVFLAAHMETSPVSDHQTTTFSPPIATLSQSA